MDSKGKKLLKASIGIWENKLEVVKSYKGIMRSVGMRYLLGRRSIGLGIAYCPLCDEYFHNFCTDCPVCEYVGESHCDSTPYEFVIREFEKREGKTISKTLIRHVQKELEFLKHVLAKSNL